MEAAIHLNLAQAEKIEASMAPIDAALEVSRETRKWVPPRSFAPGRRAYWSLPPIATAGYTDLNGVYWAVAKSDEGCKLRSPTCERRTFLVADDRLYGGHVPTCQHCFRAVIWRPPVRPLEAWKLAAIIRRTQNEAAIKSARWVLNHAHKHTTRQAYVNTRT